MRAELERRPLIFCLGSLVIGLTATSNPWNLVFLPAFLLLGQSLRSRAWAIAGFLAGLMLMPTEGKLATNGYVRAEAHILSRPISSDYGWRARADVGGVPMLLVGRGTAPMDDEVWRVEGEASPGPEMTPLAGIFRAKKLVKVRDARWPYALAGAWRDSLSDLLRDTTLEPSDQRFILGVCFGADMLDRQEMEEARASGWLRIMAASGLQVLSLAALLEGIFRILPLPRPAILCLLAIVLLVYALATGHHASTERAALAVLLSRFAYILRRDPDMLSGLALSGLMILALDPQQVFGLGFQLTMIGIGAFALFAHPSGRREKEFGQRARRWLEELGRSVMIGVLAVTPLLAQRLHLLSLNGVVGVALVITVLPLLIVGAFGAGVLGLFWRAAAVGGVELLVGPLGRGLRAFLELLQPLSVSLSIPAFSGYWLSVGYGLWLLVWRKDARPA